MAERAENLAGKDNRVLQDILPGSRHTRSAHSVAPTREFACQRKLDANTKPSFLAETRRDLLAY